MLDLLVFAPHPDDGEIGLGGTMARQAAAGERVGLCDLTRGELGSNGDVDVRAAEADAAAAVLGLAWRDNLSLPDGGLDPSDRSDAQLRTIVRLVREHRPRTVAAPYWGDRHPDHHGASRLVTRAVFLSGLRKYAGDDAPAWRPEWICYYFINDAAQPSFVIDVSAHYETKRRALACHASQFEPSGDTAVQTRLTSPRFRQLIESRDAQFGALAGVAFAEGLLVREPVVRNHPHRGLDDGAAGGAR